MQVQIMQNGGSRLTPVENHPAPAKTRTKPQQRKSLPGIYSAVSVFRGAKASVLLVLTFILFPTVKEQFI